MSDPIGGTRSLISTIRANARATLANPSRPFTPANSGIIVYKIII